MKKLKKPLLFTLALLPLVIVGSYFAARFSVSSLDKSVLDEAIAAIGSKDAVILISTVQPIIMISLCAFFGYILADKIGLIRPLRFEKSKLMRVIPLSIIGGVLLSLDAWTFAKWIPEINADTAYEGTFHADTWIASILYGGIAEEVMMRLFFMSLFTLILYKLFWRKTEEIPAKTFIIANVISAILFAAGHLPSTIMLFGGLTPMITARCFIMNGATGLLFGRFYRKYGLHYAMMAHMILHIVSRTIWIIAF